MVQGAFPARGYHGGGQIVKKLAIEMPLVKIRIVGPQGSGKTLLAAAIKKEAKLRGLSVRIEMHIPCQECHGVGVYRSED